jgi:hypothetical protein
LKDGDIRGGLKDLGFLVKLKNIFFYNLMFLYYYYYDIDRELDVLDRVIKNSENNSTTPT